MHIPDGFLNAGTWIPAWMISAAGLGISIKKVSKSLQDKMVPLMGVMSAFIFAAQMLNFPVAGGTSGHLLGGVLAAVLMGPAPAAVVLSVVLVVQCFIFQDGGLTALGANILNMSFIGTIGGYLVYVVLRRVMGKTRLLIAAGIAAWVSVVLAATACSLELAFSGTSPLSVALPAMIGVHALIGLGEAAITGLVLSFVLKVRPDLMEAADA